MKSTRHHSLHPVTKHHTSILLLNSHWLGICIPQPSSPEPFHATNYNSVAMGSALIGLISVKKTGRMQILNIFPVVPSSTSFTYSLSVSLSVCAGARRVCLCVCVCTHTCLGVCSLLLAQTVVVVCFWTFLHLLLAVAKKGQMVAASGERKRTAQYLRCAVLIFLFCFPVA